MLGVRVPPRLLSLIGDFMQKDDATWLKISYAVFAVIVGYTATKAIGTLGVQTGWEQRYSWFPMISMILSILVGIGGTWFLARDKVRNEYFLSSISEVRRVTWPSFIDTRRMTIVVCVVVGIFAAILAAFDFIWAEILKVLLAV